MVESRSEIDSEGKGYRYLILFLYLYVSIEYFICLIIYTLFYLFIYFLFSYHFQTVDRKLIIYHSNLPQSRYFQYHCDLMF